jgi:Flp pilus assembly protein CpaB
MPITTIIILSAIVAAFVLFGVVLAWGEMQTRHLGRDHQRARKSAQASNSVRVIQAKAQLTGATNTSRSKEMAPN